MPGYAVVQSHPPGNCPVSSKGAREWANKTIPQIDAFAKKHGVKLLLPYMHLDPAHKGLLVVEAPKAEDVRDFLVEAGFFHFLDNEFYMTTPVTDLLKSLDRVPTIFP